ncbi:MAG: flagellar motor protein [Methylophilaceae bacterium]
MNNSRLDTTTLIGVFMAFGAILGGQALEGGHAGTLMQLAAFIIVFGGTIGACLIQYPTPVFFLGVRLLKWVFMTPSVALESVIEQVVGWGNTARRGGLLSLEPLIEEMNDPFMRKGLQMLVDGAEPEKLREMMEVEMDSYDEHHRQAARVWESAGGYSPTIGILGAVMGLIHVMGGLSAEGGVDISSLGTGIAVAFVATLYGVGAANLFFLPFSNKIKSVIAREMVKRAMVVEGLVSVANGDNPRLIETRLRGFIA